MNNRFSNISCLQGRKYDLFEAKREFSFKDMAKEFTCFGKYIAVTTPNEFSLGNPCMLVIIGSDLRTSYVAFMTKEKSKKEFLNWVNQLSSENHITFGGAVSYESF